jgi:plasmid stabilization system protein ParE
VSRYFLSGPAKNDLAEIRRYLDPNPDRYTRPIRHGLRLMIEDIGLNPQRGAIHSEATRLLGQEVRTRVLPPYRLFYRDSHAIPEIVAVIHTARDVSSILMERLQ